MKSVTVLKHQKTLQDTKNYMYLVRCEGSFKKHKLICEMTQEIIILFFFFFVEIQICDHPSMHCDTHITRSIHGSKNTQNELQDLHPDIYLLVGGGHRSLWSTGNGAVVYRLQACDLHYRGNCLYYYDNHQQLCGRNFMQLPHPSYCASCILQTEKEVQQEIRFGL